MTSGEKAFDGHIGASKRASNRSAAVAGRSRWTIAPTSRNALICRIAVVVVFLALWEVLSRLGIIDQSFASKPSSILRAIGELTTTGDVRTAIAQTLLALLVAFAGGTVTGVAVGLVLGLVPLLREAFLPVVMLLLGIPKSVFLPILVLFLGLGTAPGIAFGALLAFLYVTINVVGGVDLVEKKYYDVATAFGASAWRRFVDVILPAAAPGLFAGLWHGLRSGFNGVLIAQLFVSTVGIGNLVHIYANNFQTDRALALEVVIAVVVIVAGSGWSSIETRLTRWREGEVAR